jgi:hypothetical protein
MSTVDETLWFRHTGWNPPANPHFVIPCTEPPKVRFTTVWEFSTGNQVPADTLPTPAGLSKETLEWVDSSLIDSLSPREGTAMPGYKNRFSFCPGAGSRTAVARKGLDIKRSELDSLFIQSWVALQDLFWLRSLD